MIKEKYLYFMDESDGLFNTAFDSLCVPLSRLKGFRAHGDTDKLEVELKPLRGYADSDDTSMTADHVTLTIAANKHKEVIQDICAAINSARVYDKPMIAICDAANEVFASAHITGCATNVTGEV
jgi:hypothetical protein|tara:strand:- start:36 stop:407 length:372 start_codon:yes stop_codon:yes gene_type:complete